MISSHPVMQTYVGIDTHTYDVNNTSVGKAKLGVSGKIHTSASHMPLISFPFCLINMYM